VPINYTCFVTVNDIYVPPAFRQLSKRLKCKLRRAINCDHSSKRNLVTGDIDKFEACTTLPPDYVYQTADILQVSLTLHSSFQY
jgi:hypothetical protein